MTTTNASIWSRLCILWCKIHAGHQLTPEEIAFWETESVKSTADPA